MKNGLNYVAIKLNVHFNGLKSVATKFNLGYAYAPKWQVLLRRNTRLPRANAQTYSATAKSRRLVHML